MESLKHYRILSELGRGGFGVVYLAEDPRINRRVAIKTLSIDTSSEQSDSLRALLQREAMSAGSLSHPNITTVYELDEQDGHPYIVMEYAPGRTLHSMLNSGDEVSQETALAILKQAAEALDFAHSRGVVHRDVKPANLIVADDGSVKVTDFGIAKMVNDTNATLSKTGILIGTAQYMAPEQVAGAKVDGRADQFGLAVIAFESLTGQRPFPAQTLGQLLHQIMYSEPVIPPAMAAKLGAKVNAILGKALSKDRDARYRTCVEFVNTLKDAVEERSRTLISAEELQTAMMPVATLAPGAELAAEPAAIPHGSPVRRITPSPAKKRWTWLWPAAFALLLVGGMRWYQTTMEPQAQSQATVTPAAPLGKYRGPSEGSFVWNGTLAVGERLTVTGSRPSSGSLDGKGLPDAVEVTVQVQPKEVLVMELPHSGNRYRVVLANTSEGPIGTLYVRWKALKR